MIFLLPHAVEAAAERSPDRDAFRCEGERISYAELSARSNQLAHLLIEQGVAREDRVGVYMPRCLESAIAVFGIMKAGAAFVPIDPGMPIAAVRSVIDDCGVRHLTSVAAKRRDLKKLFAASTGLEHVVGAGAIDVDPSIRSSDWDVLEQLPSSPPKVVSLEQDLAYIMYTSGSTGRPKGIMHTHFSGLSYARLSAHTYDVHPDDRIGNHSPLHFDMSTFGYFTGPYCGATTVLIPQEYTKLPASLSQMIQDERLTIWYSVPFALIQLLTGGVLESRDLTSLRWVLFGGEPLAPKHARALMGALLTARFSNVYGPAEVNQCTFYHVPPESMNDSSDAPIPIGKIWENTEALLIDEHENPVEPGETGELLVRSATAMSGYWSRPELNAQVFYKRDVVPGHDELFYRTGDLVRLLADGNYQFVGRKDRQAKIRGHRIELDGIEAVLADHGDVEEAAVTQQLDDDGSSWLLATVVLQRDAQIDANGLIEFAMERLPRYAVPSFVNIVDQFPRTATGKIDRNLLAHESTFPN